MHIRIWCSSIRCNTILLYIVNNITQSNPSNRTDGLVPMANVDVFCSIHQCQLSKWRECKIDPGFFFCWVDEKWGYLVEIWPSNSDCAVANQIIKDDKFRAKIRDLSWYIYIYILLYPFVSCDIYIYPLVIYVSVYYISFWFLLYLDLSMIALQVAPAG